MKKMNKEAMRNTVGGGHKATDIVWGSILCGLFGMTYDGDNCALGAQTSTDPISEAESNGPSQN